MVVTAFRADNCLNELGAGRTPLPLDGHDAARSMAINRGIARQVMMA